MQPRAAESRAPGVADAVRVRLELMKPGITLFLVLTSLVACVLASPGVPSIRLLALLALATGCTVAGASALNQIRESELDARMERTRGRPLPGGRLGRAEAAAVAVGLSATGLGLSAVFLPWTVTAFLAAGHAGYVLVYTPMKRVSSLCTPVGALPGALPVLAGWAAAGAGIGLQALAFFGAVVLWQIPHFLAIGWLCREDYARADFRVLPVLDTDGRRTGAAVVASAALLLPVSLVPVLDAGPIPAVAVVALGLAYLARSVGFLRTPDRDRAKALFFLSLLWVPAYLGILLLLEIPWLG